MNLNKLKQLLNRNNRILNITHKDLDGVGCSIILQNIYKNISFTNLKYGDVDNYLKTLNFNDYDAVIMTDISPEQESSLNLSDKIVLLDHHDSASKHNNEEIFRFVVEGNSATNLVKNFFEKLFQLDLSYLNDLCHKIDLYDCFKHKMLDPSWELNELYFYYYDTDFRRRFGNGNTKLSEDEQNFVNTQKKILMETYRNLDIYPCETVNMCFFMGNRFINDLCHLSMEKDGFDVSICINTKSNSCSVRSKNKDLHIGRMLQEIPDLNGGGHRNSGAFRIDPNQEISIKIEAIEQYLYKNFKEIRK